MNHSATGRPQISSRRALQIARYERHASQEQRKRESFGATYQRITELTPAAQDLGPTMYRAYSRAGDSFAGERHPSQSAQHVFFDAM